MAALRLAVQMYGILHFFGAACPLLADSGPREGAVSVAPLGDSVALAKLSTLFWSNKFSRFQCLNRLVIGGTELCERMAHCMSGCRPPLDIPAALY